jgi:plastocyanin
MKRFGLWAVVLIGCASSSKPHPTSGKFEDCYYDCNGSAAAPTATPAAAPAGGGAAAPAAGGPKTPTTAKAAELREAAEALDKAQNALNNGNKSLAEHYFSTAELIVGEAAVAAIASEFREGAPPRVAAAPTKVDPHSAPQPKVDGSSEADDAAAKVAPPRIEGSLTGTIVIDGKPLSGAFGLVTLEPTGGKWPARTPKHRVIEQRNREFLPHITAVPVGSTIAFPNFDSVFHNVFSTSPLGAFDLGIYKMGEAREFTFQKEGIVRLGCNLHANMNAYIAVVSAPAYVVTDDKGGFAFKHLAPGKYKLKAWSERSSTPIEQEITIKQGANEVKPGVAGDAPAGPAPDKFGKKRG